jgi:hypothetical protein
MDALMVCLHVIVSKGWQLIISDVEGAFLQGTLLTRKNGRIFVEMPREEIPGSGCDGTEVIELVRLRARRRSKALGGKFQLNAEKNEHETI